MEGKSGDLDVELEWVAFDLALTPTVKHRKEKIVALRSRLLTFVALVLVVTGASFAGTRTAEAGRAFVGVGIGIGSGPFYGSYYRPGFYGRPFYRPRYYRPRYYRPRYYRPRYYRPRYYRPRYSRRVGLSRRHVAYCARKYRSYRVSDNTFQPYRGPRRACRSRY